MGKDVIIACDFDSGKKTLEFLEKFGEIKPFVKIGLELFYAEGTGIVRELKSRGYKLFLDLKLHDIPHTVEKTMAVLTSLDVDMVNIHAAGGSAMMKAAVRGLTKSDGTRPLLISVTQLTSTDEETLRKELLIDLPMADVVASYARNSLDSGLDGVVCSPLEARRIHEVCGKKFLTVTPGVRFADGDIGDQKRVATPALAKDLGADYIVVGRPITLADDPREAYGRCVREFVG